jgi:hypothetical protein
VDDRYGPAIREHEARLAADPSNVRAMLRIADLHLTAGRPGAALCYYEQAGKYYEAHDCLLHALACCKQMLEVSHRSEVAAAFRPELLAWQAALEAALSARR